MRCCVRPVMLLRWITSARVQAVEHMLPAHNSKVEANEITAEDNLRREIEARFMLTVGWSRPRTGEGGGSIELVEMHV